MAKTTFISFLFFLISLSHGFTTKIIHRDSSISPLYKPNLSPFEAFLRDIETSRTRASSLMSMKIFLSFLLFRAPLFTVDIGVGTPATKMTLVFDTAAPLTWTQCKPCVHCFKQDPPVFDPIKSTSFKRMRKNHSLASWFNCTVLECYYYVESRTGQSSDGIVSIDTFSFKSHRLNEVVFGCGINNHGRVGPQTALTGILGFGNFPTSLARQLGNRFSYCLPELKSSRTKSSVLSFAQEAVIKGENIQTTPFLKLPKTKKLLQGTYRLNLTGISVAGKRLEIPEDSFNGGCVLDTGAPFSTIEEHAYKAVSNAISSYFSQFEKIKRIANRKYPQNLCYKYPRGFTSFPNMVLHFEEANLVVNGTSLFMFGRSLFMSNFVCLQLLGKKKTNILGIHQQQNVRVLYDLGKQKLLFGRENC